MPARGLCNTYDTYAPALKRTSVLCYTKETETVSYCLLQSLRDGARIPQVAPVVLRKIEQTAGSPGGSLGLWRAHAIVLMLFSYDLGYLRKSATPIYLAQIFVELAGIESEILLNMSSKYPCVTFYRRVADFLR